MQKANYKFCLSGDTYRLLMISTWDCQTVLSSKWLQQVCRKHVSLKHVMPLLLLLPPHALLLLIHTFTNDNSR